jgi:SAM-dependent methyltransferase
VATLGALPQLSWANGTDEKIMHPSAMNSGKLFFDTYAKYKNEGTIVDIGSQNVNGSLKSVCPDRFNYIGVDFQKANNVDVVIDDPYKLPFEDQSIDIVVSSSCLEHCEFFWLTWLEILRIIKSDGLIYINVPSSGEYHAYPVDCWRFRIDSALALMNWGQRNNYPVRLLEAYTDSEEPWKDCVAIFCGSEEHIPKYPDRIPTK